MMQRRLISADTSSPSRDPVTPMHRHFLHSSAHSSSVVSADSSEDDERTELSFKGTFIQAEKPKPLVRRSQSLPRCSSSQRVDLFQSQTKYVGTLLQRSETLRSQSSNRSVTSAATEPIAPHLQSGQSEPGGLEEPEELPSLSPELVDARRLRDVFSSDDQSVSSGSSFAASSSNTWVPPNPSMRIDRRRSQRTFKSKPFVRAMASIKELPQQLEEALHQKTVSIVTDMKSELQGLCDEINETSDDLDSSSLAVERIGRIPDLVLSEMRSSVTEVKHFIEEKMQNLMLVNSALSPEEHNQQEHIERQMSVIPQQVEQIARKVVDDGLLESTTKALSQMERALAPLNVGPRISAVRDQVVASMPGSITRDSMTAAAGQVAESSVLAAMANVRGEAATPIENQEVASLLLSSKVQRKQSPDAARFDRRGRHVMDTDVSPGRRETRRFEVHGPMAHKEYATRVPGELPRERASRSGYSLEAGLKDRGDNRPLQPGPQSTWQDTGPERRGLKDVLPVTLPEPPSIEEFFQNARAEAENTFGHPDPEQDEGRFNISCKGSVGHPEMCSRPCLYFSTGQCKDGAACAFCHQSHSKRSSHLDKRNRELLQSLDAGSRAELLLNALRSRVRCLKCAAAGTAFLDMVERQVSNILATAQRTSKTPGISRLSSALQTMFFSSLLPLFLRKLASELNDEQTSAIKEGARNLREQVFLADSSALSA
eukprot:TRINITY_DN25067_c0_g1_i1.p1 TRINITY_DN25067_c0_g1~~TRINITY_DN25067_c0_g1_i1.p1  ORF type:complete len:714 (-),score=111.66 TRINITY_DN25067_c0_g1_i1:130-2271(-)